MSCECTCNANPCTCNTCDPACEPLSTALKNFIEAFFGTVTKECVNGEVVWHLPCNLEQGLPNFPRLPNEGLACYFLRWMQAGYTGTRITVLSVYWMSPYLIQYKQAEVWANGRLISLGSPYVETILIGTDCP